MSSRFLAKNLIFWVILPLNALVIFAVSLLGSFSFWETLFLSGVIGIINLIFFSPAIGFLTILLARPSVDIFSNQTLFESLLKVNLSAFLGVFLILTTLFFYLKNPPKEKIPLLKQWTLLLGYLLLNSLVFSENTGDSLKETVRWLSFFSAFIGGFMMGEKFFYNKEKFSYLPNLIIFSAVIPLVLAIWQFLTKTGFSLGFDDVKNRLFGTFGHPNSLAYFLVFILVLISSSFNNKIKNGRFFYFLFFITGLLALLGTATRGAWILAIICFGLAFLKENKKKLLILAISVGMFFFLSPNLKNRVDDFFSFSAGNSAVWRIKLWKDSANYFKEKPFFGFGIGNSENVIIKKRGLEMGATEPHSDYLRLALDGGIFLLLIYFWLYFANLKIIKSNLSKNLPIDFLFFFNLTLLLIYGFDNILRITALNLAFWSINGFWHTGINKIANQTKSDKIK